MSQKSYLDKSIKPFNVEMSTSENNIPLSTEDKDELLGVMKNNLSFEMPEFQMINNDKVILRIVMQECKGETHVGWFYGSALSLFTLNLFGFPVLAQEWTVKLEAEVINKNNKLVKKYNSVGRNTSYSAMWWGYGVIGADDEGQRSTLKKNSYVNATLEACKNLRSQLAHDASNINAI